MPAESSRPPSASKPHLSGSPHRTRSDWPFFLISGGIGGGYILLLVALLTADVASTSWSDITAVLTKPEILFAVRMTLISCTLAAVLSLWVAVPLGYLLERFSFRGRGLIDAVLDIPVVLPPLVLGLSLLILFHLPIAGTTLEATVQKTLGIQVTYAPVAVVLAQFVVSAAFAIHSMRLTFSRIDPRPEAIAMTLGCRRSQAFWKVAFPQAWRVRLLRSALPGASTWRVRTDSCVCRCDPHEDRGPLNHGLSGAERRPPRGGCGCFSPDGHGSCRGAWNRATRGRKGCRMIELRDLSVTSGSFQLTNLALVVPTGGYGVLMGSTGSGKTTILEAICGLRTIASGRVLLGGVDVTSWSVGSRGIGYVPQDAALFPTLSVWEHLALGLKLRRVGRVEIANRVAEVAEALGIAHLLKRTPHHLSGGEARRVAIGRAIAFHPQLLLLDEPLSALDEDHRGRLVELLQSLHRSERVTTLHVTHYRDEAAAVGEHFFQLTHNQIVVCERPQAGHITRHGMANASEGNEGNIEPDTTTAQPCTDREP